VRELGAARREIGIAVAGLDVALAVGLPVGRRGQECPVLHRLVRERGVDLGDLRRRVVVVLEDAELERDAIAGGVEARAIEPGAGRRRQLLALRHRLRRRRRRGHGVDLVAVAGAVPRRRHEDELAVVGAEGRIALDGGADGDRMAARAVDVHDPDLVVVGDVGDARAVVAERGREALHAGVDVAGAVAVHDVDVVVEHVGDARQIDDARGADQNRIRLSFRLDGRAVDGTAAGEHRRRRAQPEHESLLERDHIHGLLLLRLATPRGPSATARPARATTTAATHAALAERARGTRRRRRGTVPTAVPAALVPSGEMPSKGDLEGAATLPPEDAVDTAPGAPPSPGAPPVAKWDRYELLDLLGKGGMGVVYKARDRRLDRTVAVKFILGADPNLTMRLLREARAQARIDHPNVCRVHEVGEVEGRAYIALQFVDGEPLHRAAKSMTLDEKIAVLRDVALAIHEAHKLGIVHRDLKPANVMIERSEDGRPVPIVMD